MSSGSSELEQRFESFVEQHHRRAVRLAWRLAGCDTSTAEEIAQDAFLQAQRKLDTLEDPEALRAWFTRILVRRAANHRRWRGVRERAATWLRKWARAAPPTTTDPALRHQIALAMDELSPGQREVFTLVYLEGFTLDETAELLGRAPGTVRSHLHRALRTLREALHDAMEDHR